MAEEPTLPSLPKVSWDSYTQTFTNTRKRNRDGAPQQALFSNSSDPAVFSSDDDPHVDNYVNGRHHKKRYVGSWFQQMPESSDSTFAELAGPQPKPNRTLERQLDSGVWMGSDELVDPDEEFPIGMEQSPEPKLPQLRDPRPVPSITPEELIVRTRIDTAIEDGNPNIDLSSLGVTTIPDGPISRLAEVALIPSVDRDVPFEQANPELGLYLYNNRLARAPGALFNLEHLTYLSLRNNQISELPPSIGKLRNLRELNVSLNRLRYLPGELLNLLQFPSVLSSLQIFPNPFYRPGSLLSQSEHGETALKEKGGDTIYPPEHRDLFESEDAVPRPPNGDVMEQGLEEMPAAGPMFEWQVVLHARSPVQYGDSRGSVLSRFRLPCEDPDGNVQASSESAGQHVALQTEDVSMLSMPHLPGRDSGLHSKPSRVLSLFELALKSASRAAQTWDLAPYLPPQAPPSVLQSINRITAQGALNGNSGTLSCSVCGREMVTPLTRWIEWWEISKHNHESPARVEPLSLNTSENAIPVLQHGSMHSAQKTLNGPVTQTTECIRALYGKASAGWTYFTAREKNLVLVYR
ncbi:hypothetical protein O1611_g5173 [Lasiodiplodia mahajangana]|uniref:Uncharacterized protein n=1 Tax=Lasiodiplodia mahajangana TaxID=1108764 RepID=A0ACC2JLT1_9PEZI|nr:hypothetical protein O1611_g5173 [Lasiodiplodia mahajangana]